ncbi:hypothetical protein BO99DRAFT_176501 [Aspergillus violaceofuscus CBS 115571]|uniref:Uncharacterized protein n=1 Tax=Aspergillus violaceofuscus (strain CBS 115571) TaxID=1450538 RepID=A0A2V5H215_ASPV1|nr:hypothetical protein BO99DRAFT_176501 [Aspergillus violaceofuscus CBS 115571]
MASNFSRVTIRWIVFKFQAMAMTLIVGLTWRIVAECLLPISALKKNEHQTNVFGLGCLANLHRIFFNDSFRYRPKPEFIWR